MLAANVFGCRLGAGRYVAKMWCNRPEFLAAGGDLEQEVQHTQEFGGRLGPRFRGLYRFREDGRICGPKDPTTYAVLLMDRIDGSLVRIWTMLDMTERQRAKGVVDGLIATLHKEGYAHGDLVPRNIGYTIKQGPVNSQPRLKYMFIDWGRTFRLSEAAGARAQLVLRFAPYAEQFRLGTNPYVGTPTTASNIVEREKGFWYAMMEKWPYIMRNLTLDWKPITSSEKSAVFAYWLHKFTNLPIWAVFKGTTPAHYMVILPAVPAYFADERGLTAARDLIIHWQGVLATKDLMLAPVDELLSNLSLLVRVRGDWGRLSQEMGPLAQRMASEVFVNKLHLINELPIVDPVERGYIVSGPARSRASLPPASRCSECGKEAHWLCSSCGRVAYCSAEHQLADWPRHSLTCSGRPSTSRSLRL
jgi:hypothetical protein